MSLFWYFSVHYSSRPSLCCAYAENILPYDLLILVRHARPSQAFVSHKAECPRLLRLKPGHDLPFFGAGLRSLLKDIVREFHVRLSFILSPIFCIKRKDGTVSPHRPTHLSLSSLVLN